MSFNYIKERKNNGYASDREVVDDWAKILYICCISLLTNANNGAMFIL